MEPIAIVTAFVGVLYIVGRGGYLIAPHATVASYRQLTSSPRRIRLLGILFLMLVSIPLIFAARQAPAHMAEIAIWLEGFGWVVMAVMMVVVVIPGRWQRFVNAYWDSSPSQLWMHSLLKVGFGVFLVYIAFFLL